MRQLSELNEMKNTCAVYGEFDSMHRGHIKVIAETVKEAKKAGLESVVLSFESEGMVFTTEKEKAFFAENEGVDTFISIKKQTDMDTEALIQDTLVTVLGVKILVIGENHKDLETVKALAEKKGVKVVVTEAEKEGEKIITRDAVFDAYQKSDYERIERLCGHAYIMMGQVVHGKALGRTVGMPTANIGVPDNKIKPIDGVYATLGHVEGGVYKSLTNIGKRPSVDNHDYVTIEAFLLDFKQDIYGKPFMVEVHKFIRGVQKFDNLKDVQQQVQIDLSRVREFLEKIA